jgi:hypothetical protein
VSAEAGHGAAGFYTAWRLVRVPDFPNRLDIQLVVDTTAPAVVEAIEEAAKRNGIVLERMAGAGPQRSSSPATSPDPGSTEGM